MTLLGPISALDLGLLAGSPLVGWIVTRAAAAWPRFWAPRMSVVASPGVGNPPQREVFVVALAIFVALVGSVFTSGYTAPAVIILGWSLLFAALVDLRLCLLPDTVSLGITAAALILALVFDRASLGDRLIGFALGYGVLWSVNFFYRRLSQRDGLGLGDAKLLGAAGAWLGPSGVGLTLAGAALVTLCGLWLVRGNARSINRAIPFGPGLAVAFFATAVMTAALGTPH